MLETGAITGVLPFSRMKQARANGRFLEDSDVLPLHRDRFVDMVNVSYELTQRLVVQMSNRIREFSQLRFQNEKLMALGRLSAGLAHELNNPASAMVRSAEALYKKIHQTPEQFKKVISIDITPEKTDAVNRVLFQRIRAGLRKYQLIERQNALDELIDWLDDHELEDTEELAETFVDFGLTTEDLDHIHSLLNPKDLPVILWWIESTLSLEQQVEEIRHSANRISELVQSVKSYSHMDRGAGMERIDLKTGIVSTLVMLKHALKDKSIQVNQSFPQEIPLVQGYTGELNQVWTNLIINALDAMEPGGTLAIHMESLGESVQVRIQDNGHGIPSEIQSQIFEPFFTTKKMGEGSGMGLDIVQRILERHGAGIRLISRPGHTQFILSFPTIT